MVALIEYRPVEVTVKTPVVELKFALGLSLVLNGSVAISGDIVLSAPAQVPFLFTDILHVTRPDSEFYLVNRGAELAFQDQARAVASFTIWGLG